MMSFIIALLLAGTVSAHGLEDRDVPIVDGMQACIGKAAEADRLACYRTLCAPDYECAQSLLKAATEDGGPSQGMNVLHDLMSVHETYGIKTDGHELAHVVGRQAAKHFGLKGDVFVQCPRDYFYGCGHGFFEVALALAESQSGAAVEVCGSLPRGQRFVCYHGVGHGLMMSHGNRLDESLAVCNELPKEEQADMGCWQGVFMENVNTYIRGEALSDVFDANDLLAPCNKVDAKYHRECYLNQSAVLVMGSRNSIEKASAACLKEGSASAIGPCIEGLGQFTTSPAWQELLTGHPVTEDRFLADAIDLCDRFPTEYVSACQTAAAGNLINYDSPEKAIALCAMVSTEQQDACFKKIVLEINRPIITEAMRARVCSMLSPTYADGCIHTASSSATLQTTVAPSPQTSLLQKLGRFILAPFRWLWSLFPSTETKPNASAARVVIHYADDAFIPSTVTIPVGETIQFVNDGDGYLWPASDPHPTHTIEPAFDAMRAVTREKPWSFTFDKKGTWTFHNHLSPTATGTITVR